MISQEVINRQAEARIKGRERYRRTSATELDSLKAGKKFNWTKVEAPGRLAERARRLGLFEAAVTILSDPQNIEVGNRVFEQIIGANNLLGITFLSEGARVARSVGRITLPVTGGTKLGTGFLVSPRVMMTNNHVLGSAAEAVNATLEFDFFRREEGTTGPVIRFRMFPNLFFVTDAPLDFTLVAIEETNAVGDALVDRGWLPLVAASGKALVGERVSIIQHPNGDPQKLTVHDNKIVDVADDDDFLHYETDTMGGSSGSPVLNIDWDLAALHHAAVGNSNEGIRISSIVTRLREIFQNEAVQGVDASLFSELMAGNAPPQPPPPPFSAVPGGSNGGPRMNADGTASWIVPVTLTLGVGSNDSPRIQTADASALPAPQPAPVLDDLDLQEALRAHEEATRRVYYSKKNDQKARKDYYPDLDGLNKSQMYHNLSTLVKDTHTTVLSYKKARLIHLYPWIDRRDDPKKMLKGIYSDQEFDALEVILREAETEHRREQAIFERLTRESAGGLDEDFLEQLEAQHPFNCEHVVPQSWFNKRKTPKTDLHHLFTCESRCNSFRGNRAFFDFPAEAFREDCGESDNGKFEPKKGKGAAARATLYFLLRYPDDIADSTKEMPKERLKIVIKWAKSDKVGDWERHRNAEIQKVQGNRNPLIDFPELVDKINFELGWA